MIKVAQGHPQSRVCLRQSRVVGQVAVVGRTHLARYPVQLTRAASGQDDQTPEEETKTTQQEEEPVWVRRERERELMAKEGPKDLPFGVYLLFSAIVAIAAIGSIFEYANKNPIFDAIYPDSPFYAPILGVFAITGVPTAGYLFYKAVSSANAEAERMDKLDGY